jgi:hypothetical protein
MGDGPLSAKDSPRKWRVKGESKLGGKKDRLGMSGGGRPPPARAGAGPGHAGTFSGTRRNLLQGPAPFG